MNAQNLIHESLYQKGLKWVTSWIIFKESIRYLEKLLFDRKISGKTEKTHIENADVE